MRRRDVLKTGAAAGIALGLSRTAGAISGKPREIADAAFAAARAGGATYADLRIQRTRDESLVTRDDHLQAADSSESYGLGVRVLVKGSWGFAGTQDVSPAGAKAAAAKAVAIARADAKLQRAPVALAPIKPARDTWQTPMTKDPFRVPIGVKLDLLFDIAKAARVPDVPVIAVEARLEARAMEKLFLSSEGAEIDQTIVHVNPGYTVTVAAGGDFESRRHGVSARAAGWEYVEASHLAEDAPRIAREALEKMKADAPAPGEKDLVLLPTNLWLTIHESIGHSTELDRALGYEANYAGTSFATPDQIGKLRYGGPIMDVYADRTTPGALATAGYDDDGAPTERFDLIKDGVLVDFQTTREQAAWIGAPAGHATAYAESWAAIPFQRMPNVHLAPAPSAVTLDELLSGVADGILVDGTGSYSIDQQRLNFQFSGDFFREIKNGKPGKALRHVAYQSSTPSFWSAMDAIGGADTWWMGGSLYDGKGEPGQLNAMSHGCPPARFRKVRVLDSRGQPT